MAESRHRYLFERLGDHDFQQLVNALLIREYPGYTPMALRQADGGRDGIQAADPGQIIVYQTKWSIRGTEKDPVSWLERTLRGEEKNLRRLASEGVRQYRLVTNVASTAKPRSGTYDRLEERLRLAASEFGFDEMTCVWRERLNPWVDNAPTETKWAYADMLAGWDLIRYLVADSVGAGRDKSHRDVIRKVVASQWDDDKRVKFSQVDVDRELVADLFVDVTADRVHVPERSETARLSRAEAVGGAANYLVGTPAPFTIVRGAPGQGKSTLTQYVCQTYRNSFMPEADRTSSLPEPRTPRFPIRVDLSEYALWLDGTDVWSSSDKASRARRNKKSGDQRELDVFLAELMTHESGGVTIGAKGVQDIFDRVPTLIVLDGLDEVGSPGLRSTVVDEIDKFVSRSRSYSQSTRVIVTTRPSGGELAEPAQERFEAITLNRLTVEQRNAYLRKWCLVRGIKGKDGRDLRKTFKDKSEEPYIEELAGNPMQLAILLDLLNEQGAATPTQRTELYDKYVDLLLAREANKNPKTVREHRAELMEIIPFLGWYLHAHTEESSIDGRMTVGALKAAMRHFQRVYGKRESVVDALFVGASQRLWALTSKSVGLYEFEVLSLREYFAARFLFNNAGEEDRRFDSTVVLRELLRRPFWLNTARFYGGNAQGNDVYTLTAGLEDELREAAAPAPFLASWALLGDGVFQQRPREARKVLTALCSDRGIAVLLPALDRHDIAPLRQIPDVADDGPDPTWLRLTEAILSDPSDSGNPTRVRVLRELLALSGQFSEWWFERFSESVGTPHEQAWLQIGASCEAGAGKTYALDGINLAGGNAELFLNTGLIVPPGSELEAALMRRVLDGDCPSVVSARSFPGQVAVALSPSGFFTHSKSGFTAQDDPARRRRASALTQLRRVNSEYAKISALRSFSSARTGSTAPWADTASALHAHTGGCWLASEIAIIGASSPFTMSFISQPDATAFGPAGHPSELVGQSRRNRNDLQWWRDRAPTGSNNINPSEWALALWSIASGEVLEALLPELDTVVSNLPEQRKRTLVRAATQITEFGWLRSRQFAGDVRSSELASLLALRSRIALNAESLLEPPSDVVHSEEGVPSLLSIARTGSWLKVDSEDVYR